MKKFKFLISLFVILAAIASVYFGLRYVDRVASESANAFAKEVQGKTLPVYVDLINGIHDDTQKVTIEIAEKVEVASGPAVNVTGILTIDPPAPDCKLTAINKIASSNIQVSWNCNEILTNQDFLGLRLGIHPIFMDRMLWSYSITPSGVKQP